MIPRTRSLWHALFAVVLAVASLAEGAEVERPNVVLIIGDDHGWPYYGFADSPQMLDTVNGPVPSSELSRTPNLDGLAASGVLFRNGYDTASVCLPSLFSLLSAAGFHPVQWEATTAALEQTAIGGIPYRLESQYMRTLPRELQRYGYRSWEGGKMWAGSYLDAGFTHGLAEERITDVFGADGEEFGREGWDPAHCGSTGDATPCPALAPLREFLDEVEGAPFFVWFAPKLPHGPFDAPQVYQDELAAHGLRWWEVDYLANVRWLDELVGELLRELELRDMRDDTLVIYLSDNGWGLGLQVSPGQGRGKGTPYDIGSRTPVIFNWPGRIAPADLPDLVLSSDVPATILSYAGAARVPPESVGIDLRDRIEGGPPIARSELIQHAPADTVLDPPWRYVRQHDGTEELYRIDEDPFEQVDLAAAFPERLADYRDRADAHLEELLRRPDHIEIVGRITDGGAPVVAAQVRLGGDEVASTDEGGWFVIGPVENDRERLRHHKRVGPLSWAGGPLPFWPLAVGGVALPIEGETRSAPETHARGRLRVHVDDAVTGEPVRGARVRAKAKRPSSTPRTAADVAGTYLLEGLPPNAYQVEVRRSGYRRHLLRDVVVPPGDVIVEAAIVLEPR